jgi:hypothetical protein
MPTVNTEEKRENKNEIAKDKYVACPLRDRLWRDCGAGRLGFGVLRQGEEGAEKKQILIKQGYMLLITV